MARVFALTRRWDLRQSFAPPSSHKDSFCLDASRRIGPEKKRLLLTSIVHVCDTAKNAKIGLHVAFEAQHTVETLRKTKAASSVVVQVLINDKRMFRHAWPIQQSTETIDQTQFYTNFENCRKTEVNKINGLRSQAAWVLRAEVTRRYIVRQRFHLPPTSIQFGASSCKVAQKTRI